MPASTTSQSSSTVPFSHTAAGHAGISTSADGTLLIKPCTPAEIAFYEASRTHPNFQAHMPVYMGSLTLNDSPEESIAAGALRNAQTRRDSKGAEDASSVAAIKPPPHAKKPSVSGHIVSDPTIRGSSKKEWTPSGGAKLSSNLSIVLSNATAGFVKPNIIDLKLGARLWDDDAPTAKRAKLDVVANTSTSGTLGFRVAGMKVYIGDPETIGTHPVTITREVNTTVAKGYKTYDKFYGRSNIAADGSNITSAWEEFLSSLRLSPAKSSTGTTGTVDPNNTDNQARYLARRTLILKRFLREIESIQFALENEESRMYSASILIVYEGDPDALDSAITYSTSSSTSSDAPSQSKSASNTTSYTATPKPGIDPIYTTTSHELEDPAQEFIDIEEAEESFDPVSIATGTGTSGGTNPNTDSAMADNDDEDEGEPKQKIHEVVMIDFAHAKFVPGEGSDENALRGVRSIRRELEGLLGGQTT